MEKLDTAQNTICYASQQHNILLWLIHSPLQTITARQEMDIPHSAEHVQELQKQDHNIVNHWTIDDPKKAKRRITSYLYIGGDV